MDRAKLKTKKIKIVIKKKSCLGFFFSARKKSGFCLCFLGGKKREICFLKWQFPSGLERLPRTVQRTERLRRLFTAKGERKPGFFLPLFVVYLYIFVVLFAFCIVFCIVCIGFFSRGKGDGVSQDQPNLERGKGKIKGGGKVGDGHNDKKKEKKN